MTKSRSGADPRSMSREAFIVEHVTHCEATPCSKYDNNVTTKSKHSLEYSRRKCAKNIWRRAHRRQTTAPEASSDQEAK